MKKFGMILALLCIMLTLLPGVALAMTYNNDTPSGVTLQGWSTTPDQGGKHTTINFLYTGGFQSAMGIQAPFDSSWHSLDDVRPILLAEQEGYGNYLGGSNGALGSNIKFSDNVLAAMKVQNFDPSQVGGANIPPSSTTLNSDQAAWLQKIGYSVSTASSTPAPTPTTQNQSQPNPSPQKATATSTQTNTTTPIQQSKANTSTPTVQSDPVVGQTVKTPSGQMTQEMVSADHQLEVQNPPSMNPANIPTKLPLKEETKAQKNIWLWIMAGVVIITLAAVVGRIIFVRHRAA